MSSELPPDPSESDPTARDSVAADTPVVDEVKATEAELAAEHRRNYFRGASVTLGTSLSIMLVWIYIYNMVVEKHHPVLAFFKILDGVYALVIGLFSVVVIGLAIVAVYTVTTVFSHSITNMYSMRIMEDLIRDYLLKRQYKEFCTRLLNLNEQPRPMSPFPRTVASTIFVLSWHYLIAWFYLVIFTECLYFAAWSAGVYVHLYPESMNTIPMFAVAVPFTARLMAYLRFPWADDYAAFIPGILFVVVLLLAFVAAMQGPFQFFIKDIQMASQPGFFQEGSLFWKFLRDGCLIAFYPVFGEIIFFYLEFKDLKNEGESDSPGDSSAGGLGEE